MEINLLAVVAAAVGEFAFGAIWYTFIFSKQWGKIHGFDKISKARQQEMMSQMGPMYFLQFIVTLISVFVLAKLITLLPDYSAYTLAGWLWLGFIVPTNASAVIFSNDPDEYKLQKFSIMSFAILGYLIVAVAILNLF